MKTALVFSGGGSKGAYEVGVWKALKKLGIKIDIVTGTSVGALNGVLFVQNDYRTAFKIWSNISFEQIYGKGFYDEEITSLKKIYKKYAVSFLKDGGVDTKTLDDLFASKINYKKFMKSPIDYGLITFNLSLFKPFKITKKNLNEKKLKDYVLASATCYPAFKIKTIDNNKYIDGGYYDNLPINLALEMGADKIIAVDLETLGIKKPVLDKKVQIIKIAPRNKIVNFLVFDKQKSCAAIKLGFNDTMKEFGKLDGNIYTFRRNDLSKNYNRIADNFRNNVKRFLNLNKKGILEISFLNKFLTSKNINKEINAIIEYLGGIFEFDCVHIYKMKNYNKRLLNELRSMEEISISNIEKKIQGQQFKEILNIKILIKYFYDKIKMDSKSNKINRIFKKEILGALYLLSLE